eukprot:TRINITY_DN1584_c0_g1_i2.p1 TRINITY_DN1584_c0_g1~~TRINITY_DN1584_c0_g1_i2.p1  ORF type:complete len:208 (-),score=43.42 TRINITY_DN1584_c0_g1_i2:57-680(-)
MVFYFTTTNPKYIMYMGKDKYENDELIRYGFPEDIWFHVESLSSAHVYLRLPLNETINDIPDDVLEDCAQLCKANSIQGNKLNNINVVYTPWANLKKTKSMEPGEVDYYDSKKIRTIRVEKRNNAIVNRLTKTKVEKAVNLEKEKAARNREQQNSDKARKIEYTRKEREEKARNIKEKEQKNYTSLFSDADMTSNYDEEVIDEDNFM